MKAKKYMFEQATTHTQCTFKTWLHHFFFVNSPEWRILHSFSEFYKLLYIYDVVQYSFNHYGLYDFRPSHY